MKRPLERFGQMRFERIGISVSGDWNFDFQFDKDMIFTTVLLAVFPPVGLIMLAKKLKGMGRGRNAAQKMRSMGITTMLCSLVYMLCHIGGWGALVFACGLGLTIYGEKGRKREQRFRKYLSVINGRSPVALAEIAAHCNESIDTVERELQAMIDQGYFGLTTYIDRNRGCIVLDGVDDSTWSVSFGNRVKIHIRKSPRRNKSKIYVDPEPAPEAEAQKPEPEPRAATQSTAKSTGSEDDQFGRYLSEIRSLNDRIADPEISAKIDRIEGITSHIFEIVRKKPEKLGEIRKFMNYYLPTTLKLLDSYALLEEQGIEGDNITASKKQISQIMDTLIAGFERQLDQLFSAQAIDINSDIEVLENMMAADGLKESDFKLKSQGMH